MKRNHKHMWRTVIALVLVFTLVFGTASTAFANTGVQPVSDDKTINYVSIGDSMANGYCFDGYEQGEASCDFLNGEGVYGAGAYPLQFEEYLKEKYPEYEVKHKKLASSALRAEDLNYLLGGLDGPADDWYGQVENYTGIEDYDVLSEFYKNSIKDADIITMGIGNASFGAFMLQKVTNAIGVMGSKPSIDPNLTLENALRQLNDEEKEVVLEMYEAQMAKLKPSIPAEYADKYDVEAICDIVAYTAAGFILNYKASLENIIALNPDVEIILVGLMNTTYGMEITGEDMEPIPVGDAMDEAFGILNKYIAGLPAAMQADGEWKDATFYYVDQPNPEFIVQVFDDLKENDWENIQPAEEGDEGRLSGDIVRERQITAYNEGLKGMIASAFSAAFNYELVLPNIELKDVKEFELNNPDWAYKGYGYGFTGNGDDKKNLSIAIYLAIEDAVAASTDTMEIPLTGLMKISGDLSDVFTGLNVNATDPSSTPQSVRNDLAEYLTSTDEFRGMCKIYALFKVGNGMSVHPTPNAHDEIAAAVIDAFESNYTATEETKKNLLDYMNSEYPALMEAIGSTQGVAGNVDDLAIIVAALKASNNPALEGVDLDALEAQVRELNRYVDTELSPEDQAFVMELSNDVMDRTQNLASKATYVKYEPTEESLYVALGNADANSGAPAELAKKLYGEEWEKHFVNMDQEGMICEEILNMLEDEEAVSDVEKADLISVSMGSADVTAFVAEQLEKSINGENVKLDWAELGIKDNATLKELNDLLDVAVPIVDALGLADKYMPEGMEVAKPAKFARTLVESLLYGYASYNNYYAQVLDKIHEINPEAQVMVLGLFNPVDEWTYTTVANGTETTVPIGGVVNNIIEGTNIQTLVYALQTENTVFVNLRDNVTTLDDAIAEGGEPSFADYFEAVFGLNGEKATITAAGQEYMVEQMYAALQEDYLDNEVKVTIEFLLPLIEKYYDEAYMYAYRYANDQGYIAEAIKGLETLKAELAKLDAAELGLSKEMTAELNNAIENAMETIDEMIVFIQKADVLDQETLDALIDLLNKLGQNMTDIREILTQAGIEIGQALWEAYEYLKPIVLEQLQIAVEKGTEWLIDKINEYYPLFIDWLINEALPGADKAMYDWLYNNPETVINFFIEYGDDMAPFIAEYGDEAVGIMAYVLYLYGPDAVEWALENPEEAIDKWVQWYEKHGHKVWPMIEKYLKTMDEMGMFDELKAAAAELEAYVIAYAEKVVAELEAKINELNDAAKAALEELKAAIEAVDVDAILAALEELYDAGVAVYEGATSGYYAATDESYYVALGDTNVEYAEIVAEELDLEKDQFVNYGIEDMTAAELKAYLNAGDEDLIAEIENADLITLGFNNNTITKFAADKLAAVMAGETVDMDWAPYVGKDGAAAMDKAVAAIEEALVAEGADAATIDMIATVVEAYAFACTEFACNYPEAINAIKAINPEAQVVVVGMYNPFENAVLEVEGTQIPVGDYVGMLVDLANVHYTSYALLTGNAVYVHAPAVETKAPFEEAMGIEGFASVLTDLDSLEPSAAGHEYIANQILDAMNVVSKAVYDAQKLIDEIKAFGDVTRENLADARALADAARDAWNKLTDEEKELIGLENYKVLVDFELAVAKVELGVAEDIAAAEKALAEAEAKAAEIANALKITESTVANLKAKVINKSQIKVTWKAPETTPDQYRVALIRDGKKVGTYWVAGTKNTVTLKNLLRGTNFTVRVTPVAKVDGKKYFSIYKTSNKVKTQLQKANLTVKKAGAKKQIISKDQNSTGFQIYISQDKKFKKNVKKLVYQTNKKGLNVKVKAKNFKKGTNYVKVRAYTKVNGKKVYGAWSGTVKVVK